MVTYNAPSISLVKKDSKKNPSVIVAGPGADWASFGFNPREIKYIESRLKDEKEIVAIQQVDEVVYVLCIDAKKTGYVRMEACRKAGNTINASLNSHKKSVVTIAASKEGKADALALAEGMALGGYQFLKYKEDPKKAVNSFNQIEVLCAGVTQTEIDHLNITIEATCLARTLVNEPQSFLTATELSNQFAEMGKAAGFTVEIFNKAKIKSLKMGGLLSVNLGSIEPPTFTVMEYKPAKPKNKKPLVLIGKGVVYDTGGLSLKPTLSMDSMKCDMAGAAAVGCTMYAIAKMKLPYHVVALAPATDNRPGENAYVPGDVISMMSGKTVEMLNADAEGRMILADALHYAKRYKPELVLDFATLTGAAAAAIGQYGIVAMGTASEAQKEKLKTSGQNVYERLVEFPFWDEYKDLLKSDLADMKNIGGPVAGAITAGKFLEYYIDYPWMHFDIAGPAYINAADSYRGKNGTGVAVRLLVDFIKNNC